MSKCKLIYMQLKAKHVSLSATDVEIYTVDPIKLFPCRYARGYELWLKFDNLKLKQNQLIVNCDGILNI